jgi:hypothetical protein
MINKIQNEIITTVQSTLMENAPVWETKEQYNDYVQYEQQVADTIRELNDHLTYMVSNNSNKEEMIQFAIEFVS